jgi:DNA-directed RNA polymerase specialized sigma24 family protein
MSIGSVTALLLRLKAGEQDATRRVWEAYYRRLVTVAHARLRGLPRAAADEEDIALSAFNSFCTAAGAGRFPRLDDRDDLWQVLLLLTARKAANLREHEGAQKRDWRRAQPASALEEDSARPGDGPLDVAGREPDPAESLLVAEECRRLLTKLDNDEYRQVALWKLEGLSNAEIAGRLGRSVGAVERKLHLIRGIWEDEAP